MVFFPELATNISRGFVDPLDFVKLTPLTQRTGGRALVFVVLCGIASGQNIRRSIFTLNQISGHNRFLIIERRLHGRRS